MKVYSQMNGYRHFVLTDNVGSVLHEKVVYVPSGTHRVDLDFQVPAGVNHRITAFDDNSEIEIALHRDASGVSYPYPIGSVGSITGSSAGAAYYYFLYDWEVSTPGVVLESARTPVPVTVTNGITLAARIYLEGGFNAQTGLMNDQLRVAGVIPITEPFTSLGFTHVGGGGGETLTPSLLTVTGNDAVVDWVLIELRNAAQPSQRIATRSALVRRSGQIIAANGDPVRFTVPQGSYHVAIRHRNHLGCMTASPLNFATTAVQLDLTTSATSTWGTNARKQIGGAMALWMGNVVNDGSIRYTGASNDRDPILVAIGGSVPTNTAAGYNKEDCNLDGVVKYTGNMNDRDPILLNIGGLIPTAVRVEQLP